MLLLNPNYSNSSPMAQTEKKGRIPSGYASLGTFETSFYTASWIFGVGYSLYHVYKASSRHFYKLAMSDLEPGWILGRHKDTSDSEWTVFSEVLISSFPWFLLHFLGFQYFKKQAQTSLLLLFTSALSLIFLIKCLSFKATLYILIQPMSFLVVSRFTKNTLIFWALGIWFISAFQWYWPTKVLVDYLVDSMSQEKLYIMNVTMCWINARCISYSLDVSWNTVPRKESLLEELVHFLAYSFYFPLCVGGPIIKYEAFHDGIYSPYVQWTFDRAYTFVLQILRYLFWLWFCFLVVHFFYLSAIQFEPSIMNNLDLWTLAGLGYGMGQFFHLKYVVFYGFPRPFVMADGIDIPHHPQCIGRIHLYSNMWRYFDNGLYIFLQTYIYRPVLGERRGLIPRLMASAVSFGFIFVWHGVMDNVLVWSALNFFGVTFESLARHITKLESFQRFQSTWLSPRWERRIYAFLSSPLFCISIISNFYFFMGKSNGDIYFYRVYKSWPIGFFTILFFMYSGAQTSIEVTNWEKRCKNSTTKRH
ncbi:protein-cysteine N-palmitoyltransferase Rasp isoform X1 [Lepeophtheirus salmonis]|uniref:protein-cysteine N-palmitoyltransferase Rasp isoform X1 n=1 Tax=Lepeophtheirus salmonis TaxID=72036 RepID=UPI001AE4F852|nr:protein-cysteine N-palmitoyltransferase Rasp-like isoform X1 [Lepeophtheirus salmonis]